MHPIIDLHYCELQRERILLDWRAANQNQQHELGIWRLAKRMRSLANQIAPPQDQSVNEVGLTENAI